MKIKWCSFFTPDYAERATRLRASLDKFGLDYHVEAVPEFDAPQGEKFLEAVRFKPAFIKKCLEQFAGYDAIVWTDADSEVLRPPKLLYELDCDVACRFRDSFELLSGTMYWRRCFKVIRFMPEWVKLMEDEEARKLACPEQRVLQEILPSTGLEVYRLPEEYCVIAHMKKPGDMTDRNSAARAIDPVVFHHQASRETRLK